MDDKGIVLRQVDFLDTVKFAIRKNKRFQAVMLKQIEETLGNDTDEYKIVRKIVLDGMNNYQRSITRAIFGDVEEMLK